MTASARLFIKLKLVNPTYWNGGDGSPAGVQPYVLGPWGQTPALHAPPQCRQIAHLVEHMFSMSISLRSVSSTKYPTQHHWNSWVPQQCLESNSCQYFCGPYFLGAGNYI